MKSFCETRAYFYLKFLKAKRIINQHFIGFGKVDNKYRFSDQEAVQWTEYDVIHRMAKMKRGEKENCKCRAKWQQAITNQDLMNMVKPDYQKIHYRKRKLVRRRTRIDLFLNDLSIV